MIPKYAISTPLNGKNPNVGTPNTASSPTPQAAHVGPSTPRTAPIVAKNPDIAPTCRAL